MNSPWQDGMDTAAEEGSTGKKTDLAKKHWGNLCEVNTEVGKIHFFFFLGHFEELCGPGQLWSKILK